MKLRAVEYLICSSFILLTGCSQTGRGGLAAVYRDDFVVGTAIGSEDVKHDYIYPMRKDVQELEIVSAQFDAVTPENLMKWQYLHPEAGKYNFDQADEFVDYCEGQGLEVVGHVLVWHSQTPDWVFYDDAGKPASRDVLIDRMREHIHTVVGRYKGRIKYWDVVNEAVDVRWVEDKTLPPDEKGKQERCEAFYRSSPWHDIIGKEFIDLAFQFAHEADPEAVLLYNDYSMTDAAKTDFVRDMVMDLLSKDVPIGGIGMQGHWHLEYPSREELSNAISNLASTGIPVSITELDIGVLPREENDYQGADIGKRMEFEQKLNPYTNGVPPDVEREQAEKYQMVFDVLLENQEVIDRVTIWGVSDKYSWKNDYPILGRTDHPLLFDREFHPKSALPALLEKYGWSEKPE